VIQIGDKRYVSQLPYSGRLDRIEMLIVDAQTLEGRLYSFRHGDDWAGVVDILRAVNAAAGKPFARPKLVFFATRGISNLEGSSDVPRVADELTRDGGTRTRFMDWIWHAHGPDPASYTLVGETGLGTGGGQEAVSLKSGTGLNTVPLAGTLARTGHYYDFRAQNADNALSHTAGGDVFTGAVELLQTVGRRQSAWPEKGNAGRTAAIEYLGEQVLGTKDPRTQYWTIPWAASKWETISAEIASQSYPSATAFTPEDFGWAKTELEKEIGWLNTEHAYLSDRARPFSDTTLKSWAELQSIAAKIDHEVKAPDQTTKAQVAVIAEFALEIGKELPLAGKAIAAGAAIYKFATENATIGGEPVEEPLEVKAAEAGKALVERMTAAEHYLSVDVPEVVSSDYEKLKIVGSCGSPLAREQAACPFKASDWQYSRLDQEHAAAGLLRGSKVAAYGALLPVKYNAWRLPLSKHKEANTKFAGRAFAECFYPFAHEPETGQVAIPKSAKTDGDYQITALGYLTGRGLINERSDMHVPLASVTKPLFGTGSGELAVNKEEFFSRFFPSPNTELRFPEQTTPTGWDISLCR
jgi:hypothetical protein